VKEIKFQAAALHAADTTPRPMLQLGSKQRQGWLTRETVNRKQVETLNLVCQHEFVFDISNR
jgi:hypothetical protein